MFLNVSNVSHRFGSVVVLDQVSLMLNQGDRVGLVGANGCGKSTLLKLIVGALQPDQGSLTLAPNVSLGWLPQALAVPADHTIDMVIDTALAERTRLKQRLLELESLMAVPESPEHLAAILADYGHVVEQWELRGGYDFDYQLEQVFAGLQLNHLAWDRLALSLSGGEQTRLMLALLLLRFPDVLLLDEPTNHLDFATLSWLESYLATAQMTLLVVSHDRYFLDRTVLAVAELDEYSHRLKLYPGNYQAFAVQKQAERERWLEEYQREQAEIKALQQEIKAQNQPRKAPPPRDGDKIGYKGAAQRSQATKGRVIRSAEERLKRIEADPLPEPPKELVFKPELAQAAAGSAVIAELDAVSFGYPNESLLFDQLSLSLQSRDKILIVGPNGAGKSTLLQLLLGQLQPTSGAVRWSPSVQVGYLQQLAFQSNDSRTVFEVYRGERPGFTRDLLSELVSWRLFTYEETQLPLGALSLGQIQKLQLATLMAERANVLVLDEPTNHLSFDILEQFEQALQAFPGPIIAVSHDRWFIRHFKGQIRLLHNHRLTDNTHAIEEYLGESLAL